MVLRENTMLMSTSSNNGLKRVTLTLLFACNLRRVSWTLCKGIPTWPHVSTPIPMLESASLIGPREEGFGDPRKKGKEKIGREKGAESIFDHVSLSPSGFWKATVGDVVLADTGRQNVHYASRAMHPLATLHPERAEHSPDWRSMSWPLNMDKMKT